MSEHTPGPWNACHNGECSCKSVWCADRPIATIESGEWGDNYPALRLTDDKGLSGTHAEAYMERIAYGSIPEEVAQANVRLIAAAPELLEACKGIVKYARDNWTVRHNATAWDFVHKLDAAIAKAT